ncbi:hypothetical protein HYV31_04070 [candidate division WWE3 bacterium]|nr:hypothetical protein [candidate division WWE3 bacterium]
MKYKLAFLIFAILLTVNIFSHVPKDSFLFLHDEYLILSDQEDFKQFFTRNPNNFGIANTTVMLVTFFDRLYYSLTFFLNISTLHAQMVLYFLKFLLLMYLPFVGFSLINKLFKDETRVGDFEVFVISLWYSFNTYTLIFLHGNAFALTLLLAYVLAPLSFYYFHRSVFEGDILSKLKFIFTLFLMFFSLYVFAVFVMLLTIYVFLYAFAKKITFGKVMGNLLSLAILFLPLLSMFILIPYELFVNFNITTNLSGGETYNMLKGGLLYQLLMWFSWGIYTFWSPRNIFTFSQYFRTFPSLVAPFILYGIVIYGAIKKKTTILIPIFLFLFLFFIFFSKGAQSPFGEIYKYLVENNFLFRLFRSPDNKFGFGVIFSMACLLIFVASSVKKSVFIPLIIFVIAIQGFLIFNGVAVIGENKKTSTDRIISLSTEQQNLISFINKSNLTYGYILALPTTDFGHFEVGSNDLHIGQDLLPKFLKLPFIHLADNTGMSSKLYKNLSGLIKNEDITVLANSPIRYILLRYDVKRADVSKSLIRELKENFKPIYTTKMYELYENTLAVPIIEVSNSSISYDYPVKHKITLKNVSDPLDLNFYEGFNRDWYIFPIKRSKEVNLDANIFDVKYLWQKPAFADSHVLLNNYGNKWKISSNEIRSLGNEFFIQNADGTIDFDAVIYFKTQAIFYLGIILSGFYLLLVGIYALYIIKKR